MLGLEPGAARRPGARGRRRPGPVVGDVVPVPPRGRAAALGPGRPAPGGPGAHQRRGRVPPARGRARPPRKTRSTRRSATGSSPRWSACGSTRTPSRSRWTGSASVHDAGTVLDPVLLEGQVLGALVHGLGGALFEEFRYSDAGQPQSATFLDYLCPTERRDRLRAGLRPPRVAVAAHPARRQGVRRGQLDEPAGGDRQRGRRRAGPGRRRRSTRCPCTARRCSSSCARIRTLRRPIRAHARRRRAP